MARGGHERVVAVQDEISGLRAWTAIHTSRRGPAYGGIRVWRYRNEAEAALDALRLSRSMTYKCVLAGVAGGGAKTVVLADRLLDRPAAMECLGKRIEQMNGLYRCGPDVGFTEADRIALSRTTRWLAHDEHNGLRPAGEATAEGAIWGIRAALAHLRGSDSLTGVRVAIQGLGSVGRALSRRLLQEGAHPIGADTDRDACDLARGEGVEVVDSGRIYDVEADIFAPCALGGTLHDVTIQRLSTPIVAGCANNVLARPENAQLLKRRGILFVPDFILNSGALIEGAGFERTGQIDFTDDLRRIGTTVSSVLERAREQDVSTVDAAVEMAQQIFDRETASEPAAEATATLGQA